METTRWWVVGLALLLCLAVLPAAASAQGRSGDVGADEFLGSLEDDLDAFWSERRGIRVLQRRLFEKDGRLQLSLYTGIIPNDPYVSYFPIGGRLSYYISEPIGFELSGSWNGDTLVSTTEIGDQFREAGYLFFPRDQQRWRANASVLWAPLYGKFSLLGRKIAHFDWNFAAGFGVLGVETPPEDRLNEPESEIKPEVLVGTGWTLWLTQNWTLRLDYRQFIFQKSSGGVALPSELSLGVSYFF